MVEGYPQPSVSIQPSFDSTLMPVAAVGFQTSQRNWQPTTQKSVSMSATFVTIVSVPMIIVTMRQFASVRLAFDTQDQRALNVLTLVEEFEQCFIVRCKS